MLYEGMALHFETTYCM